jgi:hypothetical protein
MTDNGVLLTPFRYSDDLRVLRKNFIRVDNAAAQVT